ncbi:uncharacterized protein LOC126856973 [Cataglyphis hispanica]|uniref:uncharacterized protein LOC126856973 n=1 Tax=Cataglyphis hispanica TaxID=1086592 RepID=UPI00217FC8BA|nr:uncharacterized protein LOC126856973 [Cataglyphis hispanica]
MKNQDLLDGWLKTGDLGYYDQDGDIFVDKRINQVLKYQSEEEISSKEFEAVLYDHRAVFEASVTEEELKQHVIEKLGFNNQLQRVIFLLRLPRFTNGKIKLLYNIARSDMF